MDDVGAAQTETPRPAALPSPSDDPHSGGRPSARWRRFWPRARRPVPLRRAWREATTVERASTLVLAGAAVVFLLGWSAGSVHWLLDAELQNDDARNVLLPYWRHAGERALVGDLVTEEQRAFTTPAHRALFRALVPLFGLHGAAKASQVVALGLLALPAWLTARRRGGPALALVLVVICFQDSYVVNRIASGLPRAFGLPLLVLYASGLWDRSVPRRVVACGLAALTYPLALALMLGWEGLACATSGVDPRRRLVRRRFLRLGLLITVTLPPAMMLNGPGETNGPLHVLARGEGGRAFERATIGLWPQPDALQHLAVHASLRHVLPPRTTGEPESLARLRRWEPVVSLLVAGALLSLLVARGTQSPGPLVLVVPAAAFLHLLAAALAYRLYAPARYTSFGGTIAGIVLLAWLVGRVGPRLRPGRRALARAGSALALTLGVATLTPLGAGLNGLLVDGRPLREVRAALRRLPPTARVAAHPKDGDIPSFWSARRTLVSGELVQPWFADSWRRQRQRMMDTLDALYATDRGTVLAFARRHGVTHLLLRRDRYGAENLPSRALTFEPFDTSLRRSLAEVDPRRHVLHRVPPAAIEWEDDEWVLVSVGNLDAPAPAAPDGDANGETPG